MFRRRELNLPDESRDILRGQQARAGEPGTNDDANLFAGLWGGTDNEAVRVHYVAKRR